MFNFFKKKITLKLIGYWRSDSALNLPDPAWFVDDTLTESEIKETVEYLKQGCYMPYTYAGYSWCRFRCEHSQLGSREQTDGFFLWPEKLWHYVESHKVKLPVEFLNEIKKGKAMPTSFNSEFDLDTTWWMKQKGLNQNRSSFLTLDSKGCLLIRFDENADIIGQIKFLKGIEKFKNTGIQELKGIILSKDLLKINCTWSTYNKLKNNLVNGIELNFKEDNN